MDQRLGRRIDVRSPGYVELAKHEHSSSVAEFHQRAVLKAVAAVQDRQEIAAGRFFEKD